MNNLKDLTVIIVTFKTNEDILYNCINSISKDVNIINIENSNDTSHKKKIEQKYNNVKVILSGKNLGYGGGNNLGIQKSETRYILISNPDVVYNNNFFEEVKNYLKDDLNFSIIGPSYNDEKILSYGSFDLSKNSNEFDKFHLKEVDWVVGCTMLLDTKKINENFYFDENFFLYFEEADLCRRIKLKGGRIYTSSKLLVDHYGHKGSAATDPKYSIETEMFRNWHWMWSSFYYKKKYSNYLIALGSMFGKLARSFIKMIFFTIVYNKKKQTMYYARFAGLINSMLGKKSWYRVKSLFD
tara:strand:- start:264 stop:1157 length:894 start_codon:yes stop_codon:yes gene_type:complete